MDLSSHICVQEHRLSGMSSYNSEPLKAERTFQAPASTLQYWGAAHAVREAFHSLLAFLLKMKDGSAGWLQKRILWTWQRQASSTTTPRMAAVLLTASVRSSLQCILLAS